MNEGVTLSSAVEIPRCGNSPARCSGSVEVSSTLKENSFNPSKDSPPDQFLNKLTMRYNKYYRDGLRTNSLHDDTK